MSQIHDAQNVLNHLNFCMMAAELAQIYTNYLLI